MALPLILLPADGGDSVVADEVGLLLLLLILLLLLPHLNDAHCCSTQ